jgi:hypothetical protein
MERHCHRNGTSAKTENYSTVWRVTDGALLFWRVTYNTYYINTCKNQSITVPNTRCRLSPLKGTKLIKLQYTHREQVAVVLCGT